MCWQGMEGGQELPAPRVRSQASPFFWALLVASELPSLLCHSVLRRRTKPLETLGSAAPCRWEPYPGMQKPGLLPRATGWWPKGDEDKA